MPGTPELVEQFTAKASLANAVIQELPNMEAALEYVVNVCETKAPCEMLADEPGTEKGPLGPNKVPTRLERIMAAPALDEENFRALDSLCKNKNIRLVRDGLRNYLAGIDVGVSPAQCGVAASGTCMVDCDKEDDRLAGMISEINVILLPKQAIYPDLPAITDLLRKRMNEQSGTFTTLITGPSRTADIERVSAIGVHGPLELHILLLEDASDA